MKKPLPPLVAETPLQALRIILDDATPWPCCPTCGDEMQFSWLNVGPRTDAEMQELLSDDPQAFCDGLVLPPVFTCTECHTEAAVPVWPESWQSPLVHPSPVTKAGPYPFTPGKVFKFCPHCGERLSTD